MWSTSWQRASTYGAWGAQAHAQAFTGDSAAGHSVDGCVHCDVSRAVRQVPADGDIGCAVAPWDGVTAVQGQGAPRASAAAAVPTACGLAAALACSMRRPNIAMAVYTLGT